MFRASAAGLAWTFALAAAATLRAESLTLELTANTPVEARVESNVDDRNFTNPRAYRQHGSATRTFQRSLSLTNIGTTPLTGPLLVINGADWSSPDALQKSLFPSTPASPWLPRVFTFWCNHVTHADSDAPGGKEPFALLNFWGYALCGDSTAALTHFTTSQGVPARKIPLNGHVAAEYFSDNTWQILDTDQNVVYLHLDNRTLASATDLRADPFLARRTKVLGRYAPMDAAASAFNTSLHEFISPKEEKPTAPKHPPAPVRAETLFPAEKMTLHFDQAPGQAVGRSDLKRWGSVREDALCLVEFSIDPQARQSATAREAVFASGYPILAAMNHRTGETITPPSGQPTFEVRMKFTPGDQITVYTQRAKASAPSVLRGLNTFLLAAPGSQGKASLVVETQAAPPELVVPVATVTLADPSPAFSVQYPAETDLTWWQLSETKDFAFVPPNLDTVVAPAERITLDPLTSTFLYPDRAYVFRIKARLDGVWGEWSAPLEFRVNKPARPAPAQVNVRTDRLRLTWPDAGEGCEYLVFGSNRLDFLPEVFADTEIVVMRNQGIEESRPNKNLVAVLAKPEIEIVPEHRFYRVITRRGGVLSVPGDLIRTPEALAAQLPAGVILQDRWQRVADPKNPGKEMDEHLGTEMRLP